MAKQLLNCGHLNLKKTLFALVDVQDAFRPGMKLFDPMVKNIKTLLEAGKALDVPLIAAEQYPEKLGHTVKELDIQHGTVIRKTQFSMVVPEVKAKIDELFGKELQHVVIFGVEAHVCMEQSAMDFRALGYDVHVVANCSMSRTPEDRLLAFDRLKQIGCFLSTSEDVIFKLVRDKNNPGFKRVQKLVYEKAADTEITSLSSL